MVSHTLNMYTKASLLPPRSVTIASRLASTAHWHSSANALSLPAWVHATPQPAYCSSPRFPAAATACLVQAMEASLAIGSTLAAPEYAS